MPKISKIETNFGFNNQIARPVLVDFQNGKIQADVDTELSSAIFRNKQNQLFIGVSTEKMSYGGPIDNNNDLYNNFIIVPDEKSNRVKLIQVDYAIISPLLEKKHLAQHTKAAGEKSLVQLNKEFGSKRIKRQTEQRERLKMNIDNVKDQLEKTVIDVNIDEMDTNFTQSSENESLYMPKINRDAATREQVYKLHDLVSEEVLNSLSAKSVEVLQAEDLSGFELYPCVLKKIKQLQGTSNSETKCNLFLYINCLIKYLVTQVKHITKKFHICEYSSLVDQHIKDNFAVNTKFGLQRPVAMRDKALCFLLVLLIIASDYEAEIEEFSKDTKIGMKKIQECCRILSLSPSGKGKNMVTIKLPLPPAVNPSLKRKRK